MSETCNRRPKCNHEKYNDYDKCILHCNKTHFNDRDIQLFWDKIRSQYVTYAHRNISNNIIIENVIFPIFEIYSNNNYNFFMRRISKQFIIDVKFVECTFTKDFDLSNVHSQKVITFDNCTFLESIKIGNSNEIQIIDSEFKNEFRFTVACNKLNIKDTKFIKDVDIHTNTLLNIDNCIFRNQLNIDGSNALQFNLKTGSCDKQVKLEKITIANIEKVELKSEVILNSINTTNIKDISFKKNVSFEQCSTLLIVDAIFTKKINFLSDNYNRITFDNTNLNAMKLESVNILNIINKSQINGALELKESCENLNIENSTINKKTTIQNVVNLVFKDVEMLEQVVLNGKYNEVYISDSHFLLLIILTSKMIKINASKIISNLLLLGEEYESIEILKTDIGDSLEINKVNKLEINTIKLYPNVKLLHDVYQDVVIKNSKFNNFSIESFQNFNLLSTTIKGELNLHGKENNELGLDNVILKEVCTFPNIKKLNTNKCKFFKEISFSKIDNSTFNETIFYKETIYKSAYIDINFKDTTFDDKMKISNVSGNLKIDNSYFKNKLDFTNGVFQSIEILSSSFDSQFLLTYASIEKIVFNSSTEELSDNNIFASKVDFSNSLVTAINITNSDFNDSLDFTQMKQKIDLSYISSTKIETLNISDSLVFNLFKNSESLSIVNFNLVNSKLDTDDTSEEIDINNVLIKDFKFDKIILLKDLNFTEINVDKFRIGNSNIESRIRIKYSSIISLNLIASTFEDLQIIDNKNEQPDKIRELRLKNTTIKNAVFDKLKYDSFLMNDAHVSEAKIGYVKFEKGSRETNRFFKNYYDSISDYIQADIYYAQEMNEQLVSPSTSKGNKFILNIGKYISGFGQNWWLPLLWAIGLTVIIFGLVHLDKITFDYIFTNKLKIWNGIWEFANPFNKSVIDEYKDFYGVWMIHKLVISIFIYHFIIAIKRKTKR